MKWYDFVYEMVWLELGTKWYGLGSWVRNGMGRERMAMGTKMTWYRLRSCCIMNFNCLMIINFRSTRPIIQGYTYTNLMPHPPPPPPRGGGGGGGTPPKLGYNAQHKLKIWTLRDLKTSEKGGLKDLKRVFDKF